MGQRVLPVESRGTYAATEGCSHFSQRGDLDKAEKIYRHIISVDANNYHAYKFLGSLSRSKNNLSHSVYCLRKRCRFAHKIKMSFFGLVKLMQIANALMKL